MRINLNNAVYSPEEIKFIVAKLHLAVQKGYLTPVAENNTYLLCSYKGVEQKGITPKWNIKIYEYNYKKRGHSLVCVDKYILDTLIQEDYERFIPPDLEVLRIDDAGWGFRKGTAQRPFCDWDAIKYDVKMNGKMG